MTSRTYTAGRAVTVAGVIIFAAALAAPSLKTVGVLAMAAAILVGAPLWIVGAILVARSRPSGRG